MPIGLQGSWTVSVKAKSAAWSQRFRIAGSTNGVDGTYTGSTSTSPVFVTGDQWGITVEHNPTGPAGWAQSRYKLGNFGASGGQFRFDVQTDDGGGSDEDFNDLVLTCAAPLSASEWFLYGTVKTYKGKCFNPCFTGPYVVVDTAYQLLDLLGNSSMRAVIEKLYPERVKQALQPIPLPDAQPFRPMLIPTGLRGEPGLLVRGSTELEVKTLKAGAKNKAAAKAAQRIEVTQLASTYIYSEHFVPSILTREDMLAVAKLKDRLTVLCEIDRLGQAPLRFVEYDRTAAELMGGSYTGDGDRETLGMTFTDEFGNYVFRFSRTLAELLAEAGDAAAGEDPSVAALPDVILQIMDELPEGVAWESAPYFNVPNVKRIDLCIREWETFEQPCQEGSVVQFLGDIAIFPNAHSELHGDGTVTNDSTAPAGPTVEHAAWWATIAVVGCFEDTTPEVTQFTVEYQRPSESFAFVTEPYDYYKIQPDFTWQRERVGPFDRQLGLAGSQVIVPTYDNIEEDDDWAIGHRHRKLFLNTRLYQPISGLVTFRIVGYANSGEPVPGADDQFTLLVDNQLSTGGIEFVRLPGTEDPGDCALLDLPSNTAPLEVRYRADDPEGFMQRYSLGVKRGPGIVVPIAGSPITGAYVDSSPFRYQGTGGFVTVTVAPATGETWLPAGHEFCAFSFHVSSTDCLTNGLSTPGGRTLAVELVGMSLPSSP